MRNLIMGPSKSIFISGVALICLNACDQQEVAETREPIRVSAAVAAVVNGDYIFASEVELEAAAQGLINAGQILNAEDPIFDQILQQLIDQKLLSQEALARGLDQDDSARHRLQAARERILGNILVENLVAEEVDESAILEMYEAQSELQQLSEEVLIRQVQVNTEDEANRLYQGLRNGDEFAEVAFIHSTDTETRAEGGLVGYVVPENMQDPIKSVIKRTAVGATSRPFATELGWHIIKVEDRRAEEPPTLDETRPKIVQFLTLSEISRALKRLRTRADIQTITGNNPIATFEGEDDGSSPVEAAFRRAEDRAVTEAEAEKLAASAAAASAEKATSEGENLLSGQETSEEGEAASSIDAETPSSEDNSETAPADEPSAAESAATEQTTTVLEPVE